MNSSSNQLPLIESVEDVILNIKVFNEDLDTSESLISKLSFFTHWYYSEKLDLFGPSKFIGYKGNTSDNYRKGTSRESGYMCGTVTQPILSGLFDSVDSLDREKADKLYDKLEVFTNYYDKKPNKRAKIYIVR